MYGGYFNFDLFMDILTMDVYRSAERGKISVFTLVLHSHCCRSELEPGVKTFPIVYKSRLLGGVGIFFIFWSRIETWDGHVVLSAGCFSTFAIKLDKLMIKSLYLKVVYVTVSFLLKISVAVK